MKSIMTSVWLALLVLLPCHAAVRDVQSSEIAVQVSVDAQGHLQSVQPMVKLSAPFTALIQRSLSNLSFLPAREGSRTVATTTWLYVRLLGTPAADGKYDVSVRYICTGPYFTRRDPPGFPRQMISQRREARLLLKATVETDGRVDHVQLVRALTTEGRPARMFVYQAVHTLERWRARPIMVAGTPVISHVLIPISFMLHAYDSFGNPEASNLPALRPAIDATGLARLGHRPAPLPDGVVAAIDSPVKLVHKTR
ncbi:energy transducer TonB [Dyella sp. A6]|uniref:energy transducer TonB n=1 Tax=Dyella aluminiiresistens TaxID=3069105 RepID=UPI002E76ADAF|nr:energy transducer TonB [Dyella sp. A6]